MLRSTAVLGILVGFAIALGAVQYWPTRTYGFNYDDYHFVRPYSSPEISDVFRGPWDTRGIEVPFYRPLTIAFFAARFHLFRLDAYSQHLLSIVLFGVAGAAGALFAWRVVGAWSAALWFLLFWTVHPAFPSSLAVWLTNQMHLVETLLVLMALLAWWGVKRRGIVAWVALFVIQTAAFMVKEDAILLLLFLIGCHELYVLLVDRSCPHVRRSVVAAAVVLLAVLVYGRSLALGGLGGYRPPTDFATMWANLIKGPTRAFLLRPTPSAFHVYESWFLIIALIAGGTIAFRRHAPTRFLIGVGVLMALAFNLPFALVTKAEQYHLIAAGSVFALAAAVDVLTRRTGRMPRLVWTAAALVAVVLMSVTTRGLTGLHAPLTPLTLSRDDIVQTWAAVPDEIKDWLKKKRSSNLPGDLAADVPYVVFDAFSRENDREGKTFRWTTSHTYLFVNHSAPRVHLTLRALMLEQPRRPFVVTIAVEGRTIASAVLEDDAVRSLVVPLPRDGENPRRMHLLEILVDHTWVPGPADNRRLGVVMYEPSF